MNSCNVQGEGLARGHSLYKIQIIQVGAIPPWLPRFAIHQEIYHLHST